MPEWAVAVIAGLAAVVLLAVVIVVLLTQKREQQDGVPAHEPAALADSDPQPTPQIPHSRQPVAPPDQAQGYGWMKASDLANHHNQP